MKLQTKGVKELSVPTLSTTAPCGEGKGMGEKCKTTIQDLPGKKPNWRCGAPNGNRNAAKAVIPLSTVRARIRSLKKRAKIMMAMAAS